MGWAILLNAQGFPALQPLFEIRIARMAQPGCNLFSCHSCTIWDNAVFGLQALCLKENADFPDNAIHGLRTIVEPRQKHRFGANLGDSDPSPGA
jgi:hypothetical protein